MTDDARTLIAKLLGSAGGKARAAKMTPEQRSEAASKAARRRWEGLTAEERAEHLEKMRKGREGA